MLYIARIEVAWETLETEKPFDFQFLDAAIQNVYEKEELMCHRNLAHFCEGRHHLKDESYRHAWNSVVITPEFSSKALK